MLRFSFLNVLCLVSHDSSDYSRGFFPVVFGSLGSCSGYLSSSGSRDSFRCFFPLFWFFWFSWFFYSSTGFFSCLGPFGCPSSSCSLSSSSFVVFSVPLVLSDILILLVLLGLLLIPIFFSVVLVFCPPVFCRFSRVFWLSWFFQFPSFLGVPLIPPSVLVLLVLLVLLALFFSLAMLLSVALLLLVHLNFLVSLVLSVPLVHVLILLVLFVPLFSRFSWFCQLSWFSVPLFFWFSRAFFGCLYSFSFPGFFCSLDSSFCKFCFCSPGSLGSSGTVFFHFSCSFRLRLFF